MKKKKKEKQSEDNRNYAGRSEPFDKENLLLVPPIAK